MKNSFKIHSLKYYKIDLFIQRQKTTNLSNQLTYSTSSN